jgi:hypothetical protein
MSVTINGTSGITTPELTLDNTTADGGQVVLKSSGYSNWNIDNYSGSLRAYYNATEYMRMDSSGNLGIGTSSPTQKLDVSGTVQSQYNAGTNDAVVGSYNFYNTNSSAAGRENSAWGAYLQFNTSTGTSAVAERMRIDSSGKVLIRLTGGIAGDTAPLQVDGGSVTACALKGGTNNYFMAFYGAYSNALIGSITGSTGSSTAYNTSSDYRLKENIAPMTGALATVAQLKPVTYTWKADGSDGQGFIAHELQAVVPDCVTGEKDAVDADGNPVYQGIDTSFLVATLTAAIQEQQAIIISLEARLTALESK